MDSSAPPSSTGPTTVHGRAPLLGFLQPDARLRRSAPLGFGFAVAAFALAHFVRAEIGEALPPGFPYLTFFPAVILTSYLAGTRPGVLCAVLSGLSAWWFFIPPTESLELTGGKALALGFYAFIVTVDISLIHLAQRALTRLDAERSVTTNLYAQQRTMYQELQHRVANNLTFVASLLELQKRRVADTPATAGQALDEARARLDGMSRIHRRLYDPAAVDTPLDAYLGALCREVLDAGGASSVRLEVSAPPVTLDINRLTLLSLLVTEVATNSVKHAFAGREDGRFAVTVTHDEPGRLRMTLDDDGPGFPPQAPTSRSLGLRIVQGLARQLDGTLGMTASPWGGARTRLSLPA